MAWPAKDVGNLSADVFCSLRHHINCLLTYFLTDLGTSLLIYFLRNLSIPFSGPEVVRGD